MKCLALCDRIPPTSRARPDNLWAAPYFQKEGSLLDQVFSFQITPLDPSGSRRQVSRALEQRTDRLSRQTYPRLWRLADRLNRVPKAPDHVLRRRRKLHAVLGLVNWLLGLFLLLPGLMDPAALTVPLLVGGVCFGLASGVLWRYLRRVLWMLDIPLGIVLCLGGVCDPAELGRFLPLGVLCVILGAAALRSVRKPRTSAFDRAADQLLRRDQTRLEGVRVDFSDRGMTIRREDGDGAARTFPYSEFEQILETRDLLLPICDDSVMILQKKDLLTGDAARLREFLSRNVAYTSLAEDAA